MAVLAADSPTLMQRLNDESLLRGLIFAGAAAATIIGATGETANIVFSDPNFLKYLISVVAPLFVAFLAVSANPLRLLVCGVVFVIPIQFVSTIAGVAVTPMIALMVMATPLALMRARAERSSGWLGPGAVLMGVFLIPGIVIGTSAGSYLVWIAETLWIGWLVYVAASEEGGQRAVLWAFALMALVQSMIALYEVQSHHILNLYSSNVTQTAGSGYFFQYGNVTRPYGTFNDPISLGDILAISVPLLIMLAIRERHVVGRLGASLVALLTSLAAISTYSRASWIGVIVGVALCTALLPGRLRAKTAMAVGAAAVIAVILALSLGGSALEHRISSVLAPTSLQSKYQGTARTDRERERGWSAAVEVIGDNPLGTGFGKLNAALNQHGLELNDVGNAQSWYLEIGGEAGLLGLAALAVLIIAILRDLSVTFTRDRVLVAAVTAAVVAMLIGWVTDVTTQFIAVSGLIASMLALLAAASGKQRPRTGQRTSRIAAGWPLGGLALAGAGFGERTGPAGPNVLAAIRPIPVRRRPNGNGAVPAAPPELVGEIEARRGTAAGNGSSNGSAAHHPETAPETAPNEETTTVAGAAPEAQVEPEVAPVPDLLLKADAGPEPEAEAQQAGDAHAGAPEEPAEELEPPLLIICGGEQQNAVFSGMGVPFEARAVPDSIKSGDPDPVKAIRHEALSRAARAVQVGDNEVCVASASRIRLRSFGLKSPEDAETARLLLHTISGRTHEVLSAVAVVWAGGVKTSVTSTEVNVRRLSAGEVERYVASGEWRGTATGYDVNGLGAGLLESVSGDFQNLSGVPIESLEEVYPAIFEVVE